MSLERRVVVTGMGVCTPLGMSVDELMNNLAEGRSSVGNVLEYNPIFAKSSSHVGSYFRPEQASIEGLGLKDLRDAKQKMAQNTRIAFNAASEAVNDSGIFDGSDVEEVKEMTGASIAAGFGGISDIEESTLLAYEVAPGNRQGIDVVNRFVALKAIPGAASVFLSSHYGLHAGPFISPTAACASGAVSLIQGYRDIKDGFADAYIAGGTGDFSVVSFAAFDRIGALSRGYNDTPEEASRPFDRGRDGFIFGDGAGVLILEELEHAKKRGAPIYAEFLGWGMRGDGGDHTAPREDGKYGIEAMQMAMNMARINPNQIEYINSHGTSTKLNDSAESRIIRGALGEYADAPFVNSTKSMIGHTLNAAGSIEAVVTVASMNKGIIHPTKNLYESDKENGCDLNYVMNGTTIDGFRPKYAVSNSFAFGGRNATLIFGRYDK